MRGPWAGPVRREVFFDRDGDRVWIDHISNQSTGYCPDTVSWSAVAVALAQLDIDHPDAFEPEIIFRQCPDPSCGQRNIVKDDWFVCAVCGATLPDAWNFDI